jgi:hypothetical protein
MLVCITIIKFIKIKRILTYLGRGLRDENVPLKLNAFQHSLVVGTNLEADNETKELVF